MSIGFTRETISHGQHSVTVLEYSGSEKTRPLWRSCPYFLLIGSVYSAIIYARIGFWNAHAFVFLLDAAAPARFPEAKEELIRLSEATSDLYPILVLANKLDLPGAVALNTIEEAFGVSGLAKSGRNTALKVLVVLWFSELIDSVRMQGISAMTGEGVDEALEWVSPNLVILQITDDCVVCSELITPGHRRNEQYTEWRSRHKNTRDLF